MDHPSPLRGDAPSFQPTLWHAYKNTSNLSSLRGNAPSFYTNIPNRQPPRHHPQPVFPKIKPQPQSAFLSLLPAEIRNLIYEFALVSSEPIPAVIIGGLVQVPQHEDKYMWSSNVPALSQTCRQIRKECLATYYAGNTFIFKLLEGEDLFHEALINGWVQSLACAKVDRHVERVGCVWYSKVYRKREVVTVEWKITATLGLDDSTEEMMAKKQQQMRLTKKQKKRLMHQKRKNGLLLWFDGEFTPDTATPKVVFTVDPPIKGLCEHMLAGYARAFENRRSDKSVRGYGALIDVIQTVCNFLRQKESDIWPPPWDCGFCDARDLHGQLNA